MSTNAESQRTVNRLRIVVNRELIWIAPGLVATSLIYYSYLLSHPYPSFGAGLFLEIAAQISGNGYALPETIPHYASDGIPFAYPPFSFYLVAVLQDVFGLDPVQLSRVLPGLVAIIYVVPVYLVARELLTTKQQASFATLLVAVSPPVLQWHISAGGLVRSFAFLFAVAGIYTGLRLFKTRNAQWVVPSLVLFSLTVLSHPQYTAFFVLTYLLLYAVYDRTLPGLVSGAIVGVGGLVLTAPWWGQVVAAHGPDVFLAASGTHGGIGSGIHDLLGSFSLNLGRETIEVLWGVVPLAGAAYLLSERRYFVPVWLVGIGVALASARFVFLIGAIATAALLFEVVIPFLARTLRSVVDTQNAAMFSIVLIATAGMGAGTLYASSQLPSHAGSASQPQFIDDNDVEAMEWVQAETAPNEDFVVMGDAAEWFPYMTKRTILVGPWGVEWKSSDAYQHQLTGYKALSACQSEGCLTATMAKRDISPSYIYVPRDGYTVRGMHKNPDGKLRQELLASERYRLVFENEGVMIYQVVRSPNR